MCSTWLSAVTETFITRALNDHYYRLKTTLIVHWVGWCCLKRMFFLPDVPIFDAMRAPNDRMAYSVRHDKLALLIKDYNRSSVSLLHINRVIQ